MRLPHLVTFRHDSRLAWGLHAGDGVTDLSAAQPQWPTLREVIAAGALREVLGQADRAADLPLAAVTLEPPIIPAPEKTLSVAVNCPDRNAGYRDGEKAAPHPSLFVRFPRSFVGHGANLVRPPESEQMDYEDEIAIVIGREGRRISRNSTTWRWRRG